MAPLITALVLSILTVTVRQAAPQVIAEGRQPQAAVDSHATIWLTYARENSIWLRRSSDGGVFGPERLVAPVKAMDLGMRRGPRIAATGNALLVTCIAGEQARGRDGDLLCWRSTDGGATWSAPRQLNSVKGSAREGLQATAAAGEHVAVVWLDLRDKGTTLYGAFSHDGGGTFSEDRLLYASPDGTVCECCAPQAAVDEKGNIAILFRNALDGNRDMYLIKSTDGGASFSQARQQGQGHWLIQSCPMDGGAVAIKGEEVVMIWRRERELFESREGLTDTSAAPTTEKLIGAGENAAMGVGPAGEEFAYFAGGALLCHGPGDLPPSRLLAGGEDPVIVSLPDKPGPLIFWESQKRIYVYLAPVRKKPG